MVKIQALAAALLIFVVAVASDEEKVSPSPTPNPSPKHLQLSPPPPQLKQEKPPVVSALPPPPPRGPAPFNGDHGGGVKGSEDMCKTGNAVKLYAEAGCDAVFDKCCDDKLVACLRHFRDESKESFLLVHNGGEDNLTVNIKTSIPIDVNKLQLTKNNTQKLSVPTNVTDVVKIVLNAGKGDCILHIRPSIYDWINSQQFLAYASRLTPLHGAYFFFASLVIAGGTWACCKLKRKSRRGGDSGVAYQQLEMGTQVGSSPSVADVDTANGWDESWDDGWDEEAAEKHHPSGNGSANALGNGSANGVSSRTPNKDGWDDDWDD